MGDGPPKNVFGRVLGRLPTWVSTNLTSSRSLKTWFRAWLAAWVGLVLLLPNASLSTMGNIAFYSVLMGTAFIPASAPIQLFLIMLVTAIGGTCTGWGLGAAAMRAALAARDQTLLQSTLLKAKESAAGYANPDAVFKAEIFQGIFLDTRASVVYGVFLVVGTFFFGVVRSYAPPLIFFSLFGTIALDIFCSIGPLFPTGQYLILNSLLISAGMYSAIAIFVILFVFPQTVNHAYLSLVSRLLGVLKTVMVLQDEMMANQSFGPNVAKFQALRAAMFGILSGLKAQSGLLNAEFTFGRLSGQDVAGLQDRLSSIVTRLNAFLVFVKLTHNSYAEEISMRDGDSESEKSSIPSKQTKESATTETYLIQQWRLRRLALQKEHHLDSSDTLPVLQAATADLRSSVLAGMTAVQNALAHANENRYSIPWAKRKDSASVDGLLDQACDELDRALKDFKTAKRLEILSPFAAALESDTSAMSGLRGMHIHYVYAAALIFVSETTLALLEHVRGLLSQHKHNRLWAPTSLRAIAHALTKRQTREEETENDEEHSVPVGQADFDTYRMDPDTRSTRGPIQKAFLLMRKAYSWSFTPEGLYVLRYCIVTFALWLPAVFHSSAAFYYSEKGVWALIMAQMTVGYFVGEHLSVYFTRILGTVAGLVFGLLIWYIGNGRGKGNPYGIAASAAVFFVPLMFIRVFAPPKHMPSALILNATVTLVVGYSWVNTHLPVVSIGYGWDVAWRRFLLVVIGCVASFIVMFVPPKSARKAIRVRHAAAISGLSNIYLTLTSRWISDNSADGPSTMTADNTHALDHLRTQLVSVATQLLSFDSVMESARWEAHVLGEWPHKEYEKMLEVERDMIAVLTLMGVSLIQMNPSWRRKLLHSTQILNPNFISDIMAVFSIVAHSLRNGEPIHDVIPRKLLDRLLYHRVALSQDSQSWGNIVAELKAYDALFYTTAVIAVVQLSQCLDELHAITRRLCGEVPFQGFDIWKNEHQRVNFVARDTGRATETETRA